MWVMRINDFLSLPKLPSHLELKSSGILHIHEAHFFTIFVSHQLLGCRMLQMGHQELQVLFKDPTGPTRELYLLGSDFGALEICIMCYHVYMCIHAYNYVHIIIYMLHINAALEIS